MTQAWGEEAAEPEPENDGDDAIAAGEDAYPAAEDSRVAEAPAAAAEDPLDTELEATEQQLRILQKLVSYIVYCNLNSCLPKLRNDLEHRRQQRASCILVSQYYCLDRCVSDGRDESKIRSVS